MLSYASIGAAAIWNHFRGNDTLVVAEGLDVFRAPVPTSMRGRTLAKSGMRARTGCNLVAIEVDGDLVGNPGADVVLDARAGLVLIGDAASQERLSNLNDGWRARLRPPRVPQPT